MLTFSILRRLAVVLAMLTLGAVLAAEGSAVASAFPPVTVQVDAAF
jgi:hypothetical protein